MYKSGASCEGFFMTTLRSNIIQYLAVLSALYVGINKPTLIQYKSMVSWRKLNDIFKDMLLIGLIECKVNNKKKMYYITAKGIEIYNIYKRDEIYNLLK